MHSTKRSLLRKQHGVYALEWAIVFPVFFMLVYAIVSYGLTFLVRESMQNAVEDGARAALRYQASQDRNLRRDAAQAVVLERLGWLPLSLRPEASQVNVTLCNVLNEANCDWQQKCAAAKSSQCVLRVDLALPYRDAALAPALPGLGVLLPERLNASASILVDQGGF